MWGSCFWFCIPPPSPSPPPHNLSHRNLSHNNFLTHNLSHNNFLTHNLSHNNLSHNNLSHNNFLTHTQSFSATFPATHTRTIFHTATLSHTIFLTTTFSHTTFRTTIFHTTTFSHAIFHPQLCHIRWHAWVSLTFVLRGRRGTCSHRPSFCVAGMALMTLGCIWRRAWAPLVAPGAAALGGIGLRFAWQVWRLLGGRGTYETGLALVTRLGAVSRHFTWQAWHLVTPTLRLCGRHCAFSHQLSFCVASVALHLWWIWWRAWVPLVARGAVALCVAGVALGNTDFRFFFSMAGVALAHIHLRFAWQAWRL